MRSTVAGGGPGSHPPPEVTGSGAGVRARLIPCRLRNVVVEQKRERMSISADLQASPSVGSDDDAPPKPRSRWLIAPVLLAAIGMFFAYRRMAWAHPINADGASNALQAWDMWH